MFCKEEWLNNFGISMQIEIYETVIKRGSGSIHTSTEIFPGYIFK